MSDRNQQQPLSLGQPIGLEFVRQLLQTERVERVYATYRNPQSELLLAITEPRLLLAVGHYRRGTDRHCHERNPQDGGTPLHNQLRVLHKGAMQPERVCGNSMQNNCCTIFR